MYFPIKQKEPVVNNALFFQYPEPNTVSTTEWGAYASTT